MPYNRVKLIMRFVCLFASVASLYAAGVSLEPAEVEVGRKLFASACSGCHGPAGEGGRGPNLMTGRQVRRSTDEVLFESVKNGLPGTDMPPTNLPDPSIWSIVSFVRSLNAPAYEIPVEGDAAAGKELYWGKGGCSNCHAIAGKGGVLGPDLTNVGHSRPLNLIREAVLKPNERLVEGFQPVTVFLKSGKKIDGVLKDYTVYTTTVLDARGELHLLRADEISDRRIVMQSPMPGDYRKKFTATEMKDLIKFLSRQSARGSEK